MDWNALTAVATFLAVFVALFHSPLVRWFNAPRLELRVRGRDSTEREWSGSNVEAEQELTHAQIDARLLIVNTGREVAKDLQVIATDLYRKTGNGEYQLDPKFVQISLRWTHSDQPVLPILPPKIGRLCDLGQYTEAIVPRQEPQFSFKLTTEVDSRSGFEYLWAGEYLLCIAIVGSNCRSTAAYLQIGVGPHIEVNRELFFSIHGYWPRKLMTLVTPKPGRLPMVRRYAKPTAPNVS